MFEAMRNSGGSTGSCLTTTLLAGVVMVVSCLVLDPIAANAEDITGKPEVIDGNTIDIAGRAIRLFGVHAPSRDETCGTEKTQWPCGENAGFALARIIGSNWVTCRQMVRAARTVIAVCHASGPGGPDINARMVADGWARATRQAPQAYAELERRARVAGKGMWGRTAPASEP